MTTTTPSPRITDGYSGHFHPTTGYLSACTAGLPTLETISASEHFMHDWACGRLDAAALGESLDRSRALFATLAGVAPERVAVGTQVSMFSAIVASGVPDGGEVLCVTGDFASVTHAFEQQAPRGVTVRYAPLTELASAVRPSTDLVAYSLVQSASGEVADYAAITVSAQQHGAQTYVDLTQSLGWLPVGASEFDFSVCHAYKWLCSPRGTTFFTVREGLEGTLTPLAAGWYSADDVWSSCYAEHTPLAAGAGRFDVSPAWPSLPGTEAALRFFVSLDPHTAHAHAVGLANLAREAIGLPRSNSAIVTWADPAGAALSRMRKQGIVASGRAGNARIAFHLWNTEADVELLERALA